MTGLYFWSQFHWNLKNKKYFIHPILNLYHLRSTSISNSLNANFHSEYIDIKSYKKNEKLKLKKKKEVQANSTVHISQLY